MKKEKHIVVKKWSTLKSLSKSEDPSLEKIEELSSDMIAHLAQLTINGIKEIDGKPIDLFKDRAWWVLEKHNLLPEYKEEEEESPIEEILDTWNEVEETDSGEEINEDDIYNQIEEI